MQLDFSTEGGRFEARVELSRLLEPWFSRNPLEVVGKMFDANGICWDKYQSVKKLVEDDPDCSDDNPIFETIEQPGIGKYPVPSGAMYFSEIERKAPQPAPIVGQHTDEILSELLNLDSATIGKLHDTNIVA